MEICITYLLQILSFFSPFRQFQIKKFLQTNHGGQQNFIIGSTPEFFSFLRACVLEH